MKTTRVVLTTIIASVIWGYFAEGVVPPRPKVMLTSMIDENLVFDGQRVIFTCTTTSVETIQSWSSDHYIGTGDDLLQLVSADGPGAVASNERYPSTIATLMSATTNNESGVTVMVSYLEIIASSQHPISSVSCRINGDGLMNETTFRVVPSKVMLTSTLINGNLAFDGQRVFFTCTTTSVETIQSWSSDHYIGTGDDLLQLVSADGPGAVASNERYPSTIATLVSATINNESGVTVMVSHLKITASSQHPISSVSCRVNSHGLMNITMFHTINMSGGTETTVTSMKNSDIYDISDSESTSATKQPQVSEGISQEVAIILIMSLVTLIIILIILIIVIIFKKNNTMMDYIKAKLLSDIKEKKASKEMCNTTTTSV